MWSIGERKNGVLLDSPIVDDDMALIEPKGAFHLVPGHVKNTRKTAATCGQMEQKIASRPASMHPIRNFLVSCMQFLQVASILSPTVQNSG